MSTELFETLYTPFSEAYIADDSACSGFTYSFRAPSLRAPSFVIDDLTIRSEPVSFANELGEFDFLVRACLVNTQFEEINCVNSAVAKYAVSDPCARTSILVNAFIGENELIMYQGG